MKVGMIMPQAGQQATRENVIEMSPIQSFILRWGLNNVKFSYYLSLPLLS
jgi:hypothetical protein